MRRIAYIGAGLLAGQLASLMQAAAAHEADQSTYFGYPGESREGRTVIPLERYLDDDFADCEFHLALGYLQIPLKRSILRALASKGRAMPALVHATAYVHPSARIGDGCVIFPGAIVGPNCEIKGGALLNTGVNLSHDVEVGEACYLSPSVTASGFCRIGAECFLGTGTLLANNVSLGERCRLGIGSVVTHALPDDTQGLGNPFVARHFELT